MEDIVRHLLKAQHNKKVFLHDQTQHVEAVCRVSETVLVFIINS
jgi:hypothetical protein